MVGIDAAVLIIMHVFRFCELVIFYPFVQKNPVDGCAVFVQLCGMGRLRRLRTAITCSEAVTNVFCDWLRGVDFVGGQKLPFSIDKTSRC